MAKSLPTGSAAQLTIPAFTLVEGLKELWLEEKFTDLTLLCQDGVQIQTHRVTLALLSPFFRRIFASLPSLEEDSVISVPDIGSDVLREVLKQVYLGSTEVAHLNPEIAFFDLGCRPYEPVKFSEQQHVADSKDWKDMVKAEITEYANTTLMFGDDEGGGGGAGFYEDYDDDEQPIFEGKKKTQVGKSKMWRYFQKLDKNTSRCNKCKADVKTQNGNTTGMRRHISRFHPEMADIVQKSEVTEEELNQGLKRSKVWTFFEVVDKESAKCRACDLIVKTQRGNTSGMARHLLRTHPALHSSLKSDDSKIKSEQENEGKDIFSDDFDNDDDNFKMPGPVDNQGTKKRSNIKKSLVWNYFVEDASGFEAKCKYCDIYVKTEAGNSSGLISHLRSGHPEQYEELNNLRGAPLRVSNTGARNSPVWQFFNDIGGDQVKCMKCGLILKYFYGTTSGLLRHLKRAHLQDFEAMKNSDKVPEENETIWKFFTENEKEEKAACNECMAEITNDHGTLALSCEEHLRANHTELLEQYESQRKAQVKELIKTDPTAVKRKYTSRVVASVIWTYFKKTETASVNQCLSCLVDIDCSQNSVAMVKHLEEVHPAEHEVFKKESGIGSKQIRKPSAIWKFFEVTPDPKRHKCLECRKEILCFQTTSNMIRHLEHNHSSLYEEFLRERHGLNSTEDIMPLINKPKKKAIKEEADGGSPVDPGDRTCPDCGKEYSCRPAMLFHYKCVHSGIRPYKCKDCGMTFARQDSWKGHTHNKERTFLCSICGKTFARRNIRDTHERAHLNDRRYPCSFCGKKFMTNQQRTNHERTHTGEKPFQCTDCGRQFAQQYQLTTHTRIHTGEKPYSCEHCSQKFRHLSSRNNHKCEAKLAANAVAAAVASVTNASTSESGWDS